jgi:hypothetical protein
MRGWQRQLSDFRWFESKFSKSIQPVKGAATFLTTADSQNEAQDPTGRRSRFKTGGIPCNSKEILDQAGSQFVKIANAKSMCARRDRIDGHNLFVGPGEYAC